MFYKVILLSITLPLLMGCETTNPFITEEYAGATATFNDTYVSQGRGSAKIFFVNQIDGTSVPNGSLATYSASYGNGSQLIPLGTSRKVPVRPLKFHLVGQVQRFAPIAYAFGSNFLVEGDLDFTPKANVNYLVKGKLSKTYSAVWIEDIHGNIVSDKLVHSDSQVPVDPANKDKTNSLKQVSREKGVEGSKAVLVRTTPRSELTKLTREQMFLKVSAGEDAKLVKIKLGEPDSISTAKSRSHSQKLPTVTYHYTDLGNIQFSKTNTSLLYVEHILPANPDDENITSISAIVNESNSSTLRYLAQSYFQQSDLTIETLDVFAEKIWTDRKTTDALNADAISWLCKILAKSKNARYRSLLSETVSEATSRKLQRHAKDSLELLSNEDVDQFIPKGKYPIDNTILK